MTDSPAQPRGRSGHGPAICSFVLMLMVACAGEVPRDSACLNLTYKEGGLTRNEYLPCVREMMAALDEVDPKTRAALDGDRQARSDGEAALSRVRALMNAAGGRNLLERWDDRALTDMNVSISNAVVHYEAFYMVRVLDPPHPFAAKTREAAESEYRGATRNYQEALSRFRRLM